MLTYSQLYELYLRYNKSIKDEVVDYRPGPGTYTMIIELTHHRLLYVTYIPDENYFVTTKAPTEAKTEREVCRDNIQRLFKNNPKLRQAFKETVDELSTPENVEKMARAIQAGIVTIKEVFDNGKLINGKHVGKDL